jgi:hypothetical protein
MNYEGLWSNLLFYNALLTAIEAKNGFRNATAWSKITKLIEYSLLIELEGPHSNA